MVYFKGDLGTFDSGLGGSDDFGGYTSAFDDGFTPYDQVKLFTGCQVVREVLELFTTGSIFV